jgi:hypothetical protein
MPQVGVRDLLETTSQVETRGEFVRECFILDKTVYVRRPDSLFVEILCIERATFDPCYFSPDQCGAVFKILRTVLRPYLELPVVGRESLEMLFFLLSIRRTPAGCARKRTIEMIFRRFKK